MKFTTTLAPAFLAPLLALANPTPTLDKRATTLCGQWDSLATGSYIVYNNLWGESSATSGSQCTTVTGISSSKLVWSTSWSWAGASSSVKSYANAVLSFTPKTIAAISTIPTTWSWSYTGSSIVADVAYDLFTSTSCSSTTTASYEIMIWLAALGGAGPISATGSTIATPTIGGVSWKLYKGTNGATTVFSFVASSSQTAFSGDLKNFLSYLTTNEGVSTSQCLYSLGAGTEPFTGSGAVLTTSGYSVSVS
ncbi:putative xyloglucan-specific endo-beta-glucanase [Diplogelasinospora grovesii]|uniref:Xyloglucan-specific endo-beta-glucanase n=1 Tax=Diplogelasinospora grovesii TaxID=303347 RepID=A0AAN6NEW4_9PEZI|nr:putative xyloglucan-specific endo-beta-glucanase [Diplogelasinospora grovesii]